MRANDRDRIAKPVAKDDKAGCQVTRLLPMFTGGLTGEWLTLPTVCRRHRACVFWIEGSAVNKINTHG
jgi:hypothetical protein